MLDYTYFFCKLLAAMKDRGWSQSMAGDVAMNLYVVLPFVTSQMVDFQNSVFQLTFPEKRERQSNHCLYDKTSSVS